MKTSEYEKGIVKVVWVNKDNFNKIYSKMFNDEESAKKFAKSYQNYLIFTLENQSHMEEFSWKLLPYGKYKTYQFLLKNYNQYGEMITKLKFNISSA